MFSNSENYCFHQNEHVVLCSITNSYSFFTTEAYPVSFFPFPIEVDTIPDFSACTTDIKREILKATNARKLLPTSTLDTYKVFGNIDMLSMGILQ
jgi:hypothetical protein